MRLVDAKLGDMLKTRQGKYITVTEKSDSTVVVKNTSGLELTLPVLQSDELTLVPKEEVKHKGRWSATGLLRQLITEGVDYEESVKRIMQEFNRTEKWTREHIKFCLYLWRKEGRGIDFKK